MPRSNKGVLGLAEVPPVRISAIEEAVGLTVREFQKFRAWGGLVLVGKKPEGGADLVATLRKFAEWKGRRQAGEEAEIQRSKVEAAKAHARKQRLAADVQAGALVPVATREEEAAEITEAAIRLVDEMGAELVKRTAPKRRAKTRAVWEAKRRLAFAAAAKRLAKRRGELPSYPAPGEGAEEEEEE